MHTLFTRTVASLILISLLALAGCAAGTNGTGTTTGSSTGPNPGSTPSGTQTDIPAEGEPLASGTPVMYEFYSDT